VYTNEDVVGCELGGVLKNVIAIASGMADGLGAGRQHPCGGDHPGPGRDDQAGCGPGWPAVTFAGLAGMGDLVATCISPQSRNRHVGRVQLGKGRRRSTRSSTAMNMVAEGVKTSNVVMEIAAELGIDMPIAAEVQAVCHHGRPAAEAYAGLLRRGSRREVDGGGRAG
jgi:glycerol-3-phosphate dehydrogenase (NAD(P)+)